ncbi:MAG: tyrosine-type recombinase/integrase [Nocardia sp.]|nr:tyrosine-type recombinase/integrase [Nocardia sp.]
MAVDEGNFVLDSGEIIAAPAPTNPPHPYLDLTRATIDEIVSAAIKCRQTDARSDRKHTLGLRDFLGHLCAFPGDTWQQRWDAAGFDPTTIRTLGRTLSPQSINRARMVVTAIRTVFCLRIIRPELTVFRALSFTKYAEAFRAAQRDPHLNRFFAEVDTHTEVARLHRIHAQFDVCCALTTQGIALADLTPGALLHYSLETRHHGLVISATGDTSRFAGALAWQVLREMDHFPPSTPLRMRAVVYGGPKSIEQLVDRYRPRNEAVRQLLIDYLTRRCTDTDYGTLDSISRRLVRHFWVEIEHLNPTQPGLEIDRALYEQWRESINWTKPKTGKPKARLDPFDILRTVQVFYTDIQRWAIDDPATWAKWAVACPVRHGELRGYAKRRRRIKERMDDRTRLRQPLLPALAEYVETRYERARTLLAAARNTELGGRFDHDGQRYERFAIKTDRSNPDHAPIRARNVVTGEAINVTVHEDYCFWVWAAVEVLRLSGIRIEELCELTHLSIRQYRRPNGEVIALLVIAPSKSDRERVIPMSAELFHVIAQIVRRLTADTEAVHLLPRYDNRERIWSEPMPYLFQRQIGSNRSVLSPGTAVGWMVETCAELGKTNPAFADLHFTPHDFRRLFATELANSGLPIHIGAALLGHLNLETFRGYVTVFNEDVIRHYQAHLDKRRQLRPTEEYRNITADEWTDFQEHFDKRKIELGGCARPYGSGCQHEFACIRCPMLNINPKMLFRLEEIEKDLLDRRARAEREAWLGEIEGIDLTLTFLRQKREQTERLARLAPAGPTMLTLEPPRPRRE